MPKRPVLASVVLALALVGTACGEEGGAFQSTTTAVPGTSIPTSTVTAAPTTTVTAAPTTTTVPVPRTATILILPAAFTAGHHTSQYLNNGSDLQATSLSVTLIAPLSFAAPVVDLQALTIIAYDNTPNANVCVMLARSSPLRPQLLPVGQVCTGDGPAFPQVRQITDLDPRRVDTSEEGAFLAATFSGPGPSLAGVQVTYSYLP